MTGSLLFNSLNNILSRGTRPPSKGIGKRMNIPSRRRLGAAALIVAGISAFLVPFLLHSPSTQGTSPSPTTTTGGDNGGKTPTTPSGGSCSEAKSHGPSSHSSGSGNGNGIGNAYGVMKNKLQTTVALVKAMGGSNPAFHLHHDTDSDNDTTHGHSGVHGHGDHDSSCAAAEEEHEQE